ncbi:helix-turn-helix domain-containing protein [Neorhizobium tomejilense]|uniref:helix-turn-helix domain-containing protein n=1 Tax=Neorhizobium tomejilense TaxID=2093828 RepID=UPI000CFA44BB|nr:helix-turn-helix transcriptional regulator [Neorhizobium tomejilense]
MFKTTTVTGENILKYWRTGADLSQAKFAATIGVPLRTYEDLESGRAKIRDVHISAACWAMIKLASESPLKLGFLPLEIAAVAKRLMDTENPPPPTTSSG